MAPKLGRLETLRRARDSFKRAQDASLPPIEIETVSLAFWSALSCVSPDLLDIVLALADGLRENLDGTAHLDPVAERDLVNRLRRFNQWEE